MSDIIQYPHGVDGRDILGAGTTAIVARLDAVIKFADASEQPFMDREKRVYERLGHHDRVVHSKNVLHGDISCNNVFIDQILNIKLGDFAGSAMDEEAPLICYETSHGHPGIAGICTKSEIFALGSTFYEIMTGSKPYKGLQDWDISDAYALGKYPSLSSLAAFNDIIAKCWAQDYGNVDEILEDIKAEVATKSAQAKWTKTSALIETPALPIVIALVSLLPLLLLRSHK
ncbi:hypothetical protein V492_04473 [Pseudogymnoascus sp. VKM F-4246]|nr:hypothetical protein V492_04473 [Pseudogymnoascus sp. VKM F-4246]